MRRFGFHLAVLGLSAGLTSPAFGVAQSAAGPQVWHLDWEDSYCIISTGDLATAGFALRMTPGDPTPGLMIVGSSKALRGNADNVTVRLNNGSEAFSTPGFDVPSRSGVRVIMLKRVPETFPAALSGASEVRIDGLREPVSVAAKGADEAISALRGCIDEKLPEWGIDPKAFHALRMPPTLIADHRWLSDEDYPKVALAANDTGGIIARMNIDATGNVTACSVVVSSGAKELDDLTCSSALKRARFCPAIGADGQPTAAVRIVHVKFRMEG